MTDKENTVHIVHSVPGRTAQIRVWTLLALDLVLRMADRVGGEYDLSKIDSRDGERIFHIRFKSESDLEIFKKLCA